MANMVTNYQCPACTGPLHFVGQSGKLECDYCGSRYDVSAEQNVERAGRRCENSAIRALEKTVTGYETVVRQNTNVALRRGKVHYALLPVWMLNTKWKDRDFLFAMNGQTGKMVGDLPVDKGRYWRMFLGVAVPVAAALAAAFFLL